MAQLPDAATQVLQVHAAFIHAVVRACLDRSLLPELMPLLKAAEDRGWGRLVAVIRAIIDGKRDRALLIGLDDEDRVIAEAILAGIGDPTSLPSLESQTDAAAAAPGLAAMILASARGDMQAFGVLADMAEQMVKVGGDMARLGAIMRRLIDGERDSELLTRGMGPLGRQLVLDILDELARHNLH
jgi:hypothetical protein